jgi:hypothetical protein
MLSSILNSQQAIQVNIQVVRIFTRLRNLLNEHTELKLEMADVKKHLQNHDKNIELVFSYLDKLIDKKTSLERKLVLSLMICNAFCNPHSLHRPCHLNWIVAISFLP